MKNLHRNVWKRLGLISVLCGGALVSAVYAYDAKFDLAYDNIEKAKALVVAASGPTTNPANQAQFDLLRRQAHQHLKAAQDAIQQATTLQDQP